MKTHLCFSGVMKPKKNLLPTCFGNLLFFLLFPLLCDAADCRQQYIYIYIYVYLVILVYAGLDSQSNAENLSCGYDVRSGKPKQKKQTTTKRKRELCESKVRPILQIAHWYHRRV
ncbi:hypothetical protein, unlikely [Trypanosoma brucei gambiense DAL972]|uniref:T. brucei spp.-specific protein n=1 Tax=Trypanosoma brucei gambiense (strain MHOM/CI/86/DAL972) TaxID=679716 RepID=C9ZTK4_TRYB9|nr:hypothetical protein, unlikely [Trypanosoma brucei gambiense DAL972]CBH12739.1 hypothetical protein, unlikely [Trypanosoma brucei gambiense DAL972]|eukprot:XP_011775019.1 hypothetical protein, unlikely [Trypanosoma brucei gambiense DAL972]